MLDRNYFGAVSTLYRMSQARWGHERRIFQVRPEVVLERIRWGLRTRHVRPGPSESIPTIGTLLITIATRAEAGLMRNLPSEDDRLAVFAAAVVTHEDAPDECTIYPEDVSSLRRRSAWITAKAGSFCDAEEWR